MYNMWVYLLDLSDFYLMFSLKNSMYIFKCVMRVLTLDVLNQKVNTTLLDVHVYICLIDVKVLGHEWHDKPLSSLNERMSNNGVQLKFHKLQAHNNVGMAVSFNILITEMRIRLNNLKYPWNFLLYISTFVWKKIEINLK